MTVDKTNGTPITGTARVYNNGGHGNGDTRTLGELFKDLMAGTQLLISQEIRLAQLEIKESVKNAGVGAGLLAGAGAFGLVGLIAAACTLGALLNLFLPVWASALIVTIVFFAIAGALGLLGRNRLKEANPTPEATIQTLKEDQEWLKQQIK
jgi:hypothetical protein